MRYELFKFDGSVLRPSDKAMKENKIPEYWDFYLAELTDVVDYEGLENVSKPVLRTARKINKEKQIDYLLELISIVKVYDDKKAINWKNTNQVVAKLQLYFEFLKSEQAKEIDKKYFGESHSILRIAPMNDSLDYLGEKNKAFELWVKDKLKSQ